VEQLEDRLVLSAAGPHDAVAGHDMRSHGEGIGHSVSALAHEGVHGQQMAAAVQDHHGSPDGGDGGAGDGGGGQAGVQDDHSSQDGGDGQAGAPAGDHATGPQGGAPTIDWSGSPVDVWPAAGGDGSSARQDGAGKDSGNGDRGGDSRSAPTARQGDGSGSSSAVSPDWVDVHLVATKVVSIPSVVFVSSVSPDSFAAAEPGPVAPEAQPEGAGATSSDGPAAPVAAGVATAVALAAATPAATAAPVLITPAVAVVAPLAQTGPVVPGGAPDVVGPAFPAAPERAARVDAAPAGLAGSLDAAQVILRLASQAEPATALAAAAIPVDAAALVAGAPRGAMAIAGTAVEVVNAAAADLEELCADLAELGRTGPVGSSLPWLTATVLALTAGEIARRQVRSHRDGRRLEEAVAAGLLPGDVP
jgi:hypothetical protein